MHEALFHAKSCFCADITPSNKCSPVYFAAKIMLKALHPELREVI
jgi:hypothetical protein